MRPLCHAVGKIDASIPHEPTGRLPGLARGLRVLSGSVLALERQAGRPPAIKRRWRARQRDGFWRTLPAAALVVLAIAIVAYAFARWVP